MSYDLPYFTLDCSASLENEWKKLSDNTSFAVNILRNWEALHYTGHFIDVDPEARARIDQVYRQTQEALKRWNIETLEEKYRNGP